MPRCQYALTVSANRSERGGNGKSVDMMYKAVEELRSRVGQERVCFVLRCFARDSLSKLYQTSPRRPLLAELLAVPSVLSGGFDLKQR